MAATTISHNKPTAGSISWTAFNIAYDGKNYTVPAGNSAARYVWWSYNNGVSPALKTADVLPELSPDDMLLFLNKKGIGLLLPDAGVVEGSLIVDETIYANAIAANQIGATHITADAIETKHIQAGAVTAEQLSVGTVSANLVANGSFEDYDADGQIIGWEATAMTGGTMQPVTGVASSGAVSIQFDATTLTANLRLRQRRDQYIPVSSASGRRWYVSARMGAGVAVTKGMYIRASWFDANKTLISNTDIQSNRPLTTTFTVYEGQAAPPATARYLGIEILFTSPNVASKMYLDEVTVNEVIVAANIGDGQITTPKLVAKSVTADKLVIRDTTNFLTDGSFEAGGSGWTLTTGSTIVTLAAADIRDGAVGTKVYQTPAASIIREATSDAIPAESGDWYYASCYVRATVPSTSTSAAVGLAASVVIDGASTQYPLFDYRAANSITSTWTLLEGKIKLPPKTLSFQLRVGIRNSVVDGNFQFDDVTLRRMNGGELIVDGAIKTNHIITNTLSGNVIAANTIVGTKMVADSITSRELVASEIWANAAWISAIRAGSIAGTSIVANSITAGQIAANAVTASEINATAIWADSAWINAISGKRIIGASIETESAASRGVQITSAKGLQVFSDTGTELLRASKAGVEVLGTFEASGVAGGPRVVMSATLPGLAVPTRYESGLEFYAYGGARAGTITTGYAQDGLRIEGTDGAFISLNTAGDISLGSSSTGAVKVGSYSTAVTRIPQGILSRWDASSAITISTNTTILSRAVKVPPKATIRVSIHLGGYPSASAQYMDVFAYADGVEFGKGTHHSPGVNSGTDAWMTYYFTSALTTEKSVTFRVAGTTAVPSTSLYTIPARVAGAAPRATIIFEDLGDA